MKNNSQTRNYAEAMGQAMAFGISVTCCDIFNNPQTRGYIHGVCYGVAIHRMGDVVIMRTVRCHDYLERALDGAESEGTESTVIDMSDLDKSIYLQEHGRVPGTDGQREEGRDGGASSPADGISAGL